MKIVLIDDRAALRTHRVSWLMHVIVLPDEYGD